MKKILMVEDEPILHIVYRQLLNNELSLHDVEVLSAYDFDEAVTTLTQDEEKEQTSLCVILDLDLGDGHNGWEILDGSYLAGYKRVLVFICSSSGSLSDQEKALEYPQVIGYFQKPIQQHFARIIASKFVAS
jgi:CheY-like chemotaxis protein